MNDFIPPSKQRTLALRLLRGVLATLGWRYRVYVPAVALLSAVFLLPPRFLQFFTGETARLAETGAGEFVRLLVVFGLAIAACLWIAIFLTGVLGEWLRLRISMGLRRDALHAIHRTPLEVFDGAHRGDWMTRVTSDLRNCEDFLSDSIPRQIQALTLALGAAVLFFLYSGPVALIPCGAAVAMAWFNASIQKRVAPVLRENRELEGEIFQSLMENYEGVRTIRSAGGESENHQRLEGSLRRLYAAGMRIIRMMAALMGLNELTSQVVVTIALTVAALALQDGEITAEAVLVYPFFINVFLSNARDLAAAAFDWNRFFIEGGRLAAVLHQEGREEDSTTRRSTIEHSPGPLSVRGLEIGYGDGPSLVSDLSLEVGAGEMVAVMGPSGSGKSTLLECLSGLRAPRAGTFAIGEDSFPRPPLKASSFVEQRPYLFVGSVRENLMLGNSDPEFEDSELWRVLEMTGLEGIIRDRGGLETVLTDRGLNLSEGQRYRLALSRAFLAGRPFLLLDEPFAALDGESVRIVIDALQVQRRQGVGIVLVTHVLPEFVKPDRMAELS